MLVNSRNNKRIVYDNRSSVYGQIKRKREKDVKD